MIATVMFTMDRAEAKRVKQKSRRQVLKLIACVMEMDDPKRGNIMLYDTVSRILLRLLRRFHHIIFQMTVRDRGYYLQLLLLLEQSVPSLYAHCYILPLISGHYQVYQQENIFYTRVVLTWSGLFTLKHRNH